MKICYLANASSVHTQKWVKHFVDIGYEVHVISHVNSNIEGAYVHYIDYNIRNFLFKKSEVHNKIRIINPDILHAHQANTCGLYAVTMKGYRTVVSAWGSDILLAPEQSLVMKKIVQYVLKRADIITSDAEFMTKRIIELGGYRSKVYTFPMGIEDNLLSYKRSINTESNSLRIITNRKHEPIYNIDVIIKGYSMALKKNKDLFLTIAADGSYMNKLKNLVKDLNIESKVVFTGKYNIEELGNMLIDNDVFISIPDSDSTSVSLLESMCCGLFPIVSDLPGNREWIDNGKNGLVLENIDSKAVEQAILWCSNNKNILKEASFYNAKLIEKKALWRNNIKIVEDIYNKLLSNK